MTIAVDLGRKATNQTKIILGSAKSAEVGLFTETSPCLVEEPGFKNVKKKHFGMPPF